MSVTDIARIADTRFVDLTSEWSSPLKCLEFYEQFALIVREQQPSITTVNTERRLVWFILSHLEKHPDENLDERMRLLLQARYDIIHNWFEPTPSGHIDLRFPYTPDLREKMVNLDCTLFVLVRFGWKTVHWATAEECDAGRLPRPFFDDDE